jgi:outer membrane protein TolC
MSERGHGLALLAGAAVSLSMAAPVRADDLSLRAAIDLALGHAPELRLAAADEAEAQAGVRAARSASRPGLWVRTGPGYASGVPAPVLGELPTIAAVQLRQSLFDPEARASEAVARAQAAPAHGRVAAARVGVARATAESFGRLLLDAAGLAAATRRADWLGRAREQVEARLGEGRASELELERASLDEARARADAGDWRERETLERLTLASLVGSRPEDLPRPSAESVAGLAEPAAAQDLERATTFDPELSALAGTARQLDRAAGLRRGWFQPVIEVEAQYARLYKTSDWDAYYPRFQPDSWSVGASVALPLYGGRTRAEAARARAAADAATAKRELRERELALEVARARSELERARARASLAERALSVAQRGLRDAEALSAEGRLEPADMTRRQLDVCDAERDAAQARYELLAKKVALLALRGELE